MSWLLVLSAEACCLSPGEKSYLSKNFQAQLMFKSMWQSFDFAKKKIKKYLIILMDYSFLSYFHVIEIVGHFLASL